MAILTHKHLSRRGATGLFPGPALLLLLMLACVLMVPRSLAQDRQYQLKAAFLVNFAQYVEWPPQAFATGDSPFVFGVLGDNPFGPALKDLVAGELINGRKAI